MPPISILISRLFLNAERDKSSGRHSKKKRLPLWAWRVGEKANIAQFGCYTLLTYVKFLLPSTRLPATARERKCGPSPPTALLQAARSVLAKEQAGGVAIYQNGLTESGNHAIAEGVSVERDEITQFKPAIVGLIHVGDAGDLVFGKVVPVIVAGNFEEGPCRSFHVL